VSIHTAINVTRVSSRFTWHGVPVFHALHVTGLLFISCFDLIHYLCLFVLSVAHLHLVPRSRMSRSYTASPPKRHHGVQRDCFALCYKYSKRVIYNIYSWEEISLFTLLLFSYGTLTTERVLVIKFSWHSLIDLHSSFLNIITVYWLDLILLPRGSRLEHWQISNWLS
jgi:hypothetical protein